MGITTIIVSIGSYEDRDVALESFRSGKRHESLRDLSNARDGWGGGFGPEALLFGGAFIDLVWHDFTDWLEAQDWEERDSVEVLVKDSFADRFEVWRFSADQRLSQVLGSSAPTLKGDPVLPTDDTAFGPPGNDTMWPGWSG